MIFFSSNQKQMNLDLYRSFFRENIFFGKIILPPELGSQEDQFDQLKDYRADSNFELECLPSWLKGHLLKNHVRYEQLVPLSIKSQYYFINFQNPLCSRHRGGDSSKNSNYFANTKNAGIAFSHEILTPWRVDLCRRKTEWQNLARLAL
jgi:hypothetical protein